jgi:rhamnogalacturonyl hydrolase YesR
MAASKRQAKHLLNIVPRFYNGAISQREDIPELWADFVYMAPPFLAYHARATNDAGLLAETVRQLGLYRQVLRADTTAAHAGLWQHIVGPQSADHGLWSTGNAWAAAGMVRVLGVIQGWRGVEHQQQLARTVAGYVKEILDGARAAGRGNGGLLRNYLADKSWFGEASGTALLAAAAYRAAVLAPDVFGREYIAWADESRKAVAWHVDGAGIVKPTVNPLAWRDRKPYMSGSPEGQSFTVMLYAAYRDCVCAEVCND